MVQGKTTSYSYKVKKRIQLPREKWDIVKNVHDPIIKRIDFETVSQLIERKKINSPSQKASSSLLSSFVYCAECHSKMTRHIVQRNGKKIRKLRCLKSKKQGKKVCSNHLIEEGLIIKIVLFYINASIREMKDFEDVVSSFSVAEQLKKNINFINNEIAHMGAELKKVQNDINTSIKAVTRGIITANQHGRVYSEYLEMEASIMQRIQELTQKQKDINGDQEEFRMNIKKFVQYKKVETLTRDIIVALVHKIYVSKDKKIKIVFKHENTLQNITSIFANK